MLRVLILGAGGFIGSHLTAALARRDDLVLTLFGEGEKPRAFSGLRYIQGDFGETSILERALKGQDVAYHLISRTIPSTSWDAPGREIEETLSPALKLIEIAADIGLRKVCFASSGGTIYGSPAEPANEESLTDPFSPHGIIKRTVESFLHYARVKNGLGYDIYRISNVYGEGQNVGRGLGFINTALENIIDGRPVVIYGDGENIRDYIYVKDAAHLMTLSLSKEIGDSDIYNVSSNQPVSLNQILTIIRETIGSDFEVQYREGRLSDSKKSILDNSKILSFFKDNKLSSLEQGVRQTYNYLLNKHDAG